MTKETQIKKAIKDYLKLRGLYYWHNLAGLGAFPGLPDINVLDSDGCEWAIEVKAPRGKLSENQKRHLAEFNRPDRYRRILVARSLDDVMRKIK